MKKITLLLGILLVFASCQNENVDDTTIESSDRLSVEEELALEEDILTSDLEENDMELTADSETLITPSSLFAKGTGNKNNNDCTPDIEGLVNSLPEKVNLTTTSKRGEAAYFSLDILDTNLAETDLEAWCVDIDLSLEVEGPIEFEVYSSYGELPEGAFDKPENFDLVNWILNQSYVGSESPNGGTYTYGHVQWAIWELLENTNCRICDNLTNPIGTWRDDSRNLAKGQEILQAALDNGEGYSPSCGDQFGIILIPDGKQPLIITKEVPALEVPCSDCEGEVTELELKFDWHRKKQVKIYQRKENSRYGVKLFDQIVEPGETFKISGANQDGTFGKNIYIYVGYSRCSYYTKIRTDCDVSIGPGYFRGVFEVVSGVSSDGGELCEYEKNYYNPCRRYWKRY